MNAKQQREWLRAEAEADVGGWEPPRAPQAIAWVDGVYWVAQARPVRVRGVRAIGGWRYA